MNRMIGLLVLSGLLSACNRQDSSQSEATADKAVNMIALEAPSVQNAPLQREAFADASSGTAAVPVSATPRQLIYRAEVDIKVEDLGQAATRLDSIVRGSGSWVSQANQTRSDEMWQQQMTIRVRPERFTSLLAGLSRLGTVENKSMQSEDVTAEHADVAARLRTKRALEQRYVGLLSQAKKVSEVLEIEAKIGEVREEIEAAESRLKALNDQVAYSTITLKLYQLLPKPTPDVPVLSFSNRVVEAFYGGWQLITSLVVATVYLWPLLILGSAGLWLLRRWRLRRNLTI